jgi:aspartate/methionine/tyrosine aminotransferase
VISVASLSKCHGAPGLRIGWAITCDPDLRRQLVLGKFNTIVSCPRVDEALALKLFERRAPVLAERRVLLDAGLQRTAAWMRANNNYVEWVRPNAGAICCVRLRKPTFDETHPGASMRPRPPAAPGSRRGTGSARRPAYSGSVSAFCRWPSLAMHSAPSPPF